MSVTAQLADGRSLEFPDGTDPAVVQSTVKRYMAPAEPRKASGAWDAMVAGAQGTGSAMLLRGKLPDVVLDPQHASWYEKLLSSGSAIFADAVPEIAGALAGGAAGTAAAPGIGTAIGSGAGAMAVPAEIRESLMKAYQNGEANSSTSFLSRVGIVIKGLGDKDVMAATAKAAAIGGATMGVGKFAAPLGRAAQLAAETGTLAVTPAALDGRLPEMQDFADAAILLAGMKGAIHVASKVLPAIYAKTGTRPEQVVTDAQSDPTIKEDLQRSGPWIPTKEELLAEAPSKDIGPAPEEVAASMQRIRETQERVHKELLADPERLAAYAKEAGITPEEYAARIAGYDVPRSYQLPAIQENAKAVVPDEKATQVLDQPFADLPETKLPTQLNLKSIDGPVSIQATLIRMSQVYSREIEEQRGGTQSHAETEAKAQAALNDLTGGEAAKIVTGREPGTAANAVELHIRGDLLMKSTVDAATAIKTYNEAKAKGTATDQMKLDALETIHRSAMIQADFTGAAAETARALEYMKRIKDVRDRGEKIKQLLDLYGKDTDLLLQMAGKIDTPAGLAKLSREVAKASAWDMVIEAYKAGIIGPISQVANILGNTTFVVTHDIAHAAAALIPGGEVRMAEVPARVIGQFQGAYEGLKIAADFLGENWKNPMQALRKLDEGGATKMEQHRKAIPGDLGVLVRSLSFPWLSAADGAARMILERGEVNSWAARQAAKEGYNPFTRDFRERMAELAQALPDKVKEDIAATVQRGVFQDPLGAWGKKLQSLVSESKVGPLFIPFMQTPSNVFKEMARLTPLTAPFVKAWREDFMAGGAARDKALAEIAVGGSMMGVTMWLSSMELITGYGPPDPAKRAVWLETHQPYSAKFGDTWYDYSRIQPIGTLIGLAGDMQSIWEHMNPSERDKLPRMISIAFSQAVTNQVWLRGMVDIARGVAESDRYGPKIVQNLASSMLPASGWLGQTAQIMDPYVREINGIMDAIRNKIPLAREGLQPSVSAMTGQPIQNRERLGVVSPISMRKESMDPVLTEAVRLGVGVSKAPKNIQVSSPDKRLGQIELTPEQQNLFTSASGQMAHQILTQLVTSPSWAGLPDLMKKRIFAKVFTQARKAGAMAAVPGDERVAKAQEIADQLEESLK